MNDTLKISAYFWPGSKGQLYCLEKLPDKTPVKSVLLISQPFAEEANKSRHMFALVANRLANSGVAVVLLDHYGTGDSEGSLEDADIRLWAADFRQFRNFLSTKHQAQVSILAVRFGALLLFADDAILPSTNRLWLWNPVLNGKQLINQLFRTRLASEMFSAGKSKLSTADLRGELKNNGEIEIAGYKLSAAWVDSVEKVDPGALIRELCCPQITINWVEISPKASPGLSVAVTRYIDEWALSGLNASARTVEGTPFWATQEITTAPLALDQLLCKVENEVFLT